MQIYSAVALVSAARNCVYVYAHVYVYLRIGACICTIAHCVYAYMLRRAVVQADRGGEGHKLNDVNALSTLCPCERKRHTGLPSRVHRPPDWLLLPLPSDHQPDDRRCPPCLDVGPSRLIIIIEIYTLQSSLVRMGWKRANGGEKTSMLSVTLLSRNAWCMKWNAWCTIYAMFESYRDSHDRHQRIITRR